MKKLITLFTILFAVTIQAQGFFVVGVDPMNAILGSTPTGRKAALDFQVKAGVQYKLLEVAVVYENFASIDFQQYSMNINILSYPFYKFEFANGIEGGSIVREGNSNFYFVGLNSELRYNFAKRWDVGIQANLRQRGDITYLYDTQKREYRFSTMINLKYTLR